MSQLQGEMVDCIEHHVDQAVDYLDKGTGELIEAHRFAEKARRVSRWSGCYYLLIWLIKCVEFHCRKRLWCSCASLYWAFWQVAPSVPTSFQAIKVYAIDLSPAKNIPFESWLQIRDKVKMLENYLNLWLIYTTNRLYLNAPEHGVNLKELNSFFRFLIV